MVKASPGGTIALLAEAGEDEVVSPKSKYRAAMAQAAAQGGSRHGGVTIHGGVNVYAETDADPNAITAAMGYKLKLMGVI